MYKILSLALAVVLAPAYARADEAQDCRNLEQITLPAFDEMFEPLRAEGQRKASIREITYKVINAVQRRLHERALKLRARMRADGSLDRLDAHLYMRGLLARDPGKLKAFLATDVDLVTDRLRESVYRNLRQTVGESFGWHHETFAIYDSYVEVNNLPIRSGGITLPADSVEIRISDHVLRDDTFGEIRLLTSTYIPAEKLPGQHLNAIIYGSINVLTGEVAYEKTLSVDIDWPDPTPSRGAFVREQLKRGNLFDLYVHCREAGLFSVAEFGGELPVAIAAVQPQTAPAAATPVRVTRRRNLGRRARVQRVPENFLMFPPATRVSTPVVAEPIIEGLPSNPYDAPFAEEELPSNPYAD